jgi:hypothetical protein
MRHEIKKNPNPSACVAILNKRVIFFLFFSFTNIREQEDRIDSIWGFDNSGSGGRWG